MPLRIHGLEIRQDHKENSTGRKKEREREKEEACAAKTGAKAIIMACFASCVCCQKTSCSKGIIINWGRERERERKGDREGKETSQDAPR